MFKSILVCTDGSRYGDTARTYGIELARRVNARLLGLHVMDARMLEGPLMADISGWIGASPYAAQLPHFRDLLREKADAIAEAFRAAAREAGLDAEVIVRIGHPVSVILEESAKAELIVLGQKGEHAEFLGDLTGSTADRVTRHLGRPCLVTPAEFRSIRKVLIAYDGSVQAGQALELAAELAATLTVPVVVLSVAQREDAESAGRIAEQGLRLARDHGVAAEALTVEATRAGSVILDVAERQACDLIALGASGHGRLREFFLGSAAAHVTARSTRPVLLAR